MKKLVILVIVPVIIGLFFCYGGAAFAEHTGPGKYNNEDLNKYETPKNTGEKTTPDVPDKISNEKKNEDLDSQQRADWCRRGTPVVRAIAEANKEIDAINNNISSEESENVLPDTVKKERINNAMRKLNEAEGALHNMEDEAHSKGVPVGWIRCNFD